MASPVTETTLKVMELLRTCAAFHGHPQRSLNTRPPDRHFWLDVGLQFQNILIFVKKPIEKIESTQKDIGVELVHRLLVTHILVFL